MNEWKRAGREALQSGAAASLLSMAALAVAGRIEGGSAAGPLNGPSQWFFGRGAARRRDAGLRYTLSGMLIHHATAFGWALLHERFFGRGKPQTMAQRLRSAAVTATAANVVDFRLTPERLTPGYQHQLSRKSLFFVYAAFAVGLAVYGGAASKGRTPPARR